MTRMMALAAASTLSIACATTAHAEDRSPPKPPPGSHLIEVEVVDVDRDALKQTAHFELVAPEGATSQLSTRGPHEATYDVRVTWRAGDLDVAVDRKDGAGAHGGIHVVTHATFVVGQRLLLGRVARAGGGATDIVAVVR